MKLIDHFGGRKNVLGYIFIGCTTYLVANAPPADYVGLSTVIGTMAAGVFGLVWGNVKEHQTGETNGGG